MNAIPKRLVALIWSSLILFALPARGEMVTANFTSATTVPVTAASYTATGNIVNITLGFAPTAGTNLTVVKNTGLAFIQGTFDNLAQGQKVNMSYNGITYPFVVNYFGGTGNDLVLQWANTRLLAWGDASHGKLGNNCNIESWVPVPVDSTGVLAGKTITSVGAGVNHSLALCSDGSLAAWGYNYFHELGSDSTTDSSLPVAVDRTGVLAGKTVIAIAVKRDQNLALCSDGSLVAWGSNLAGQLGNNSTEQSSGPVAVDQSGVLAGKAVVAISCGDGHAIVLCSDGTLATWGSNYQGQLGTNGPTSSLVPVLVDRTGVLAGKRVVAISAGGSHNLALCSDGTLASWGANDSGQLGNNTTVNRSVPVLVNQTGVLAGKTIVAVSGAETTSLVLTSDGVLAAWGANVTGQLGNNSTTDSSLPVLVNRTGVLAGKAVVAIASGNNHHLAFCSDGTLATWGTNESGQLGNNSSTFSSVPVLVNTGSLKPGERFAPRSQVAGYAHTLAVVVSPPAPQGNTSAATAVSDTTATLHGSVNPSGTSTAVSFEYGLTTDYGASVAATPAIITGTSTVSASATLTDLMSGTTYHYRLVADGPGGVVKGADMTFTTSAFARLSSLALSDGTLDPGFAPVITRYAATVPSSVDHLTITPVPDISGATVSVNGSVVASGEAGPLNLTEGLNPIAIVVTAAGGLVSETYTVLVTRLPQTFRFQAAGQVGASVTNLVATGSTADFELDFAPSTGTNLTVINNTGIRPIAGTFTNLAQGQPVSLSHGGIRYAFVANYFGGSGNDLVLQWANVRVLSWSGDSAGDSLIPMPVDATGILSNKSVIALAAGQFFSVAVCSDGTLAAWGYNASGRLGNNSTVDSKVPVAVVRNGVLANKVVVNVAAGGDHVVALCSDGTLAAWGSNASGKLGNPSVASSSMVPVAVRTTGLLAGKTVVAVAAGGLHSLALCSDGTLAAWGGNNYGQLGNNSNTQSSVPVAVDRSGLLANKTVVAIAAGTYHSLALCSDGTLAAWGRNDSGELGTTTTIRSSVPVAVTRSGVLSGKTITAVAAGADHNLVLCTDGTVAAWGWDYFGQLGTNTTLPSVVPIAIDRSGVLAARTIVSVTAGATHSLALCADGTLTSWGDNTSGGLGNNSKTQSAVPVLVNTDSLRPGERFETAISASGASHTVALVAAPPPLMATTTAATGITDTGAILAGTVNPNGSDTSVTFEYGLTQVYGLTANATPAILNGTSITAVSATITGLLSGSIYHYRVIADAAGGKMTGEDMSFTTSTFASLSGLVLSTGTLDPGFVPATIDYAATVPFATDHITVTPVTAYPAASVKINGKAVASGSASGALDLTAGDNLISVVVTAADGFIMQTYRVVVTRLPEVFRFHSSGEVPVTVKDFVATGIAVDFELLFQPLPGTNLTVIDNTGGRPITGTFSNVAEGQILNLPFAGVAYPFVASYHGGTGNDLVLRWANTRLVAWGRNNSGQLGNNSYSDTLVPVPVVRNGVLSDKTWVGVATGSSHSVALCADGTLAAWGANYGGQLGNNSLEGRTTPVAVDRSGALAGKTVIDVASGAEHCLALCADGTLVAWGFNSYGVLGDNSTTNRRVPVLVNTTGVLAGKTIVAVAAGWNDSFALCDDGTLAAWGYNSDGRLGTGNTTGSTVPVLVDRTGVLAGKKIASIAAGVYHSLALCSDGTLAAWGNNSNGQLGNSSVFQNSAAPLLVDRTGALAGKTVIAIAAGEIRSLALCSDGSLVTWGGGVGTGNATPVAVDQTGVIAGKTISSFSLGRFHSIALCSDGTLATWGDNTDGQLGNNSTTGSSVPVLVNTTMLKNGERFVAARSGISSSHSIAVVASPPPPVVTTVAASGITDTGATLNAVVNANGSSTASSFEIGLTSTYGTVVAAVPAALPGTGTAAVSATVTGLLSGTIYHYRVIADSAGGVVRGADLTFTTSTFATLSGLALSAGNLDPGFAPVTTRYAATVPFATNSITVTPATADPGASVTVNGVAVASGTASDAIALTGGDTQITLVVTAVDGVITETYGVTVTRLPDIFRFQTSGETGVTVAGMVATGMNVGFELRYHPLPGTTLTVVNNTGDRPIRGTFGNLAQGQVVTLPFEGIDYRFVASYFGGNGNDLVLRWANTRLLTWGANTSLQLGNGSSTNSAVPVAVDPTGALSGKTVVTEATGFDHSVAVCSDGTLAAWGNNMFGQLANSSIYEAATPIAVGRNGALANHDVLSVAAGDRHTLALCSDGTVAAWGRNDYGQLGVSGSNSKVPVAVNTAGVLAGKMVVAVAAGDSHSLVLCSDGTLAAWGQNWYGQLGNNTASDSSVPVAVAMDGVLAGRTVVAIVAGNGHNLALCADGTVAAWGRNDKGQLGYTGADYSPVPVAVDLAGAFAGKLVVGIAAGTFHSLALAADGTMATWGNSSTTSGPVLVNPTGALSGKTVVAISCGAYHSLAMCSDGTLTAWGENGNGQLGNNTWASSAVPVWVAASTLKEGERFVAAFSGSSSSHNLALVATPPPPAATTLPATVITDTGAILNGSVNAAGVSTSVSFQYGLTTNYGTTVAADPAAVSGTETTAVSKAISGLTAGATYHYRVVAANPNGTTRGADMTFTTTNDNPDGDNQDNLIEYAFNLPPNSGVGSPFSIKPSTSPTGRVELGFTRPVGATSTVTYYLEYSSALGPAASWIPIPLTTISPRNIDIVTIDELTERVTVRNLEARQGFVRFRVELDANGDRITDHISYTGIEGWTESAMRPGTCTYNNPYQHEPVFTGTVDATGGVSGQTLHFVTSAGSTDLGTLLVYGAAYYVEVTAGPNEGQRFDVAAASGNALTLLATSDVCSDTPPFNTLAGAPPANLAGNRIAIHRHWTLGGLFPVGRFHAADDAAAADQVQTSALAEAGTYWLCSNSGSPKWVKLGDGTLADQGNTVLAPGRGLMVLKRGTATSVLAYGGVRANNFVRPLCAGLNLVGGGWPIIQSATGTGSRQMDPAHGFLGGLEPATSDMFSIWKGDATPGATAYDDYYLYDSGTAPKWVRTGDSALVPVDAQPLFLGDRAVLIRMRSDMHGYAIPNPLNGAAQSAAPMQGLAASGSGQDAATALIAHAFGLDASGAQALPQGKLVGDSYVIEFTEPPGVTGITYVAECSATLLPGSWTAVPDTGTGSAHIFSVPVTGGSLFMRIRVTEQ